MIEPAGFGVPVVTGPQTWNFADVVAQLKLIQGIQSVQSGSELTEVLQRLLRNPAEARAQGERAQALIVGSQGATRAIASRLLAMSGRKYRCGGELGTRRELRAA